MAGVAHCPSLLLRPLPLPPHSPSPAASLPPPSPSRRRPIRSSAGSRYGAEAGGDRPMRRRRSLSIEQIRVGAVFPEQAPSSFLVHLDERRRIQGPLTSGGGGASPSSRSAPAPSSPSRTPPLSSSTSTSGAGSGAPRQAAAAPRVQAGARWWRRESTAVAAAADPQGAGVSVGGNARIRSCGAPMHLDPELWGADAGEFDPGRFERKTAPPLLPTSSTSSRSTTTGGGRSGVGAGAAGFGGGSRGF